MGMKVCSTLKCVLKLNQLYTFQLNQTCILLLASFLSLTLSSPIPQPKPQEINCKSLLSQSLPECQRSAQTYGQFGDVWGEITVEVQSPVLTVVETTDRKKKRRNKNKKKTKKQV